MKRRSSASIILYDSDGKLLLQHREDDAPTFPNYWGLFGGGIEGNETPKQGAKRELLEELNYSSNKLELFIVQKYNNKEYQLYNKRYIFIAYCDNKDELKLSEGQGMKWYNIDEIDDLKIRPDTVEALKLVNKKIKNRSTCC